MLFWHTCDFDKRLKTFSNVPANFVSFLVFISVALEVSLSILDQRF